VTDEDVEVRCPREIAKRRLFGRLGNRLHVHRLVRACGGERNIHQRLAGRLAAPAVGLERH
jgi:hypothetical protein